MNNRRQVAAAPPTIRKRAADWLECAVPSTEFQLAVQCCQRMFAGGNDLQIAELGQLVDWPAFLRLAQRHRVQALVWQSLSELDLRPPSAVADALSADASSITETNLRAAAQSAKLLETFTEAGVPLLFVKGLTVSKLAYGQAFLKMSQDIDVLVPGEAIAAAAAQLERLGYSLVIPAVPPQSRQFERWHLKRKESVWRSPDGLQLELHSRLADSPDLIPGIGVNSPRQLVTVAPGIVLPTLAGDELFAYLCVHGASSAWFRLKWITDLAALLHNCPTEEIERLYNRSQQLGAGRAAAQALLLANRVYGTPAVPGLDRKLVHRWLAKSAWQQMLREDEPTAVRFGTATIHYTQLFLLPGILFHLRELWRQLEEIATWRFTPWRGAPSATGLRLPCRGRTAGPSARGTPP